MTPERWQRVKNVLAVALEREDTGERDAFLAETCANDTGLLREVRSLLNQPPDEFEIVAETIGLAQPEPFARTKSGQRIGAYELERELGRGGMGTVWLARRADRQFEKIVAIKLLKRGTDTDEVLRRFEAERQMLARLEHPNIARLFDAGTTDDGLPYFVMEYVRGLPVTDFCTAQKLSIEQRLRLFLKICAAVQFAHQNLIVHRDLKPANILIGEDGEPKLLDFGIAKLLAPEEHAHPVTLVDRQRLTPAYASPEQVRGDSITTVSDIYALGALLYEMLTEESAHRFSTSHPAPTELLRVVVQEEPARPSATADDPSLKRRLRGDLDNIVLKALRKEPARRYGGLGSFAEDIRRHLENLPVLARKDTLGYRAGKFLKRNKLAVAAALLVLGTLLGGIVATTLEARAARRERSKAERRFNDVRQIANSLMFELHNSIKDIPGALAARQLLMKSAAGYLDSLAHEAGDDLSLKSELATAYTQIGLVTFDVGQAIESHRKAAALAAELSAAAPANPAYRRQLSESYNHLSDVMKISGNSAEAIVFARKALAALQPAAAPGASENQIQTALADRYLSLGIALSDAGDLRQALEADLRAAEIAGRITAQNPSDEKAAHELGSIYANASNAFEDRGDYASALAYAEKSAAILNEFFAQDPSSARNRREMWGVYFRAGRQLAATGQMQGASENYARAIEMIEALAAADPNDRGHRRWLAVTYWRAGDFQASRHESDAALARYQQAIAISEELLRNDPGRVEVRRDLTKMYQSLGQFWSSTGDSGRAIEYLGQAFGLAEKSATQDPENARVGSGLAELCADLARAYRKLAEQPARGANRAANLRNARAWYQRSREGWELLKRRQMLAAGGAQKAEEIERELAACDELLR